ncbi:MAG TPA: hypothetical protein VF290_11845 [Pyrinomonadaceae bacterium]|jgi:hypothetical protein
MESELSAADFHDSEAGDVYALFNAVDGVIVDGLLDVRKLDEYSVEDAKALNVPRLREVWRHTASGCSVCQGIIHALGRLRKSFKATG